MTRMRKYFKALLLLLSCLALSTCAAPRPKPTPIYIPPRTVPPLPTHTATPTRTPAPPTPTPTPETGAVLYFYFAPEGCPYCSEMAPVIERFYREYGPRRRAFGELPIRVASLDQVVVVPKRDVEVAGVPIHSWGSVDAFKRRTGLTIPIVSDPGLPVSTSRHPVSVFYNKQTRTHRVAAVGVVDYATLTSDFRAFAQDRAFVTKTGGS